MFLDVTSSPEVVGISAIALAAVGLATFTLKALATVVADAQKERAEEREVRIKEAAAQQALLDALRASARRPKE